MLGGPRRFRRLVPDGEVAERGRSLDSFRDVRILPRRDHRTLTARAARTASTVSEMMDWSIISTLPHRARTGVSVGEKAVLVLNARNR